MKFGSTGQFPRGKLIDDDEGELILGVATKDKTLVINFGTPVVWIGLDKQSALDFANLIIKRANEL